MKTSIRAVFTVVVCSLLVSAVRTCAIEGITLSVQCSNVVLSWPSAPGETYFVQYRSTLDPAGTPWQTLTSSLPASAGTNLTLFIHSNIVQHPDCGGSSFGMPAGAGGSNNTSLPSAIQARVRAVDYSFLLPPMPPQTSVLKITNSSTGATELLSGIALKNYLLSRTNLGVSHSSTRSTSLNDLGGGSAPETGFYRVVRNGVHLFGLTNGMVVSGIMNIPIEMSLSSTDHITGVSFYGDGAPLIGATGNNDNGNFWMMEWDTRMTLNGAHAINAGVDFIADDSVTNQPLTITVSNAVSFPNYFSRIFGSQMWIYAELNTLEADFEIDMYADETNYIGYFYGSTSDGIISFIWDLTDGYGYTFTNETFRGDFYIMPAGLYLDEGSGASASQRWGKEKPWSGIGDFVVAFSALNDNETTTYKIHQMMIGGDGEYGGVVSTLNYQGFGPYALSPGNVYGSSAFCMADSATKTNLLSYLAGPSYHNFYFFGHGGPSSFGIYQGEPTITAAELRRTLLNVVVGTRAANKHPYRLVFIDGCKAGKGNLCEEFGVPAQTLDNAFFDYTGVRSRAFLGFKGDVAFNQAQWDWRSMMLGGFFDDWIAGKPLYECVSNAVHATHTSGYQPMPSSVVTYGAADLRMNSP